MEYKSPDIVLVKYYKLTKITILGREKTKQKNITYANEPL